MSNYMHNALDLSPLLTLIRALSSSHVRTAGLRLLVPGSLPLRLSVAMGNIRMHRLLDRMLQPGDTVIDVGANIGYNALFAARCVGPRGKVIALEPAQDNLQVLYANLFANRLDNVTVLPYAAGKARATQQFFLRGNVSGVNSLFADNFYHPITDIIEVHTVRLDEFLDSAPTLVKIDVEGGELDVLEGMTTLLANASPRLIVEWHPLLQQGAGRTADALPRYLLAQQYQLEAVSHFSTTHLDERNIPNLVARLLHTRSPVEIVATRASPA